MMEADTASGRDWRPSSRHWGIVSKTLHWLMAAMIIGMIVAGVLMTRLDDTEIKFQIYQVHKSMGLTVMVLALIRLLWRVPNPAPQLPAATPGWQKLGAHFSHLALYGLMVAMPLTGWLMVSASTLGIPTYYFDLFEVPHLIEPNENLAELFVEIHELLAYAFTAVIVLHLGAALKHHLVNRDGVLRRMMPGRPSLS